MNEQEEEYTADVCFEQKAAFSREDLCRDITELLRVRSGDLVDLGFTPEMAKFDCLITMKVIVDELHDQFNVGHARQEWYREYVRVGFKDRP
jgi:ketol-acid reductoisomerase